MSDSLLVAPCSEVALGPGEGVQLVRPQLGGGQQGPPPAGGGHHLLINSGTIICGYIISIA